MSADSPEHNEEPDSPADAPRILNSAELLQGRREVLIEHEGEIYRLRLTTRGRLYLSK